MPRSLPRNRFQIRETVRFGLLRLGFEIRRAQPIEESMRTPLEFVLAGALAVKRRLNIVQVGANDGRIEDPIYDWVSMNRAVTRILLVEPQTELHGILRENYKEHPSAYFSTAAISTQPDEQTLYRIRPSAWEEMKATYYQTAPAYRAPSGVTSADREHVLQFAREFGADQENPERYIESITVPSVTLGDLLVEAQLFSEVDLLQIDTEGFDDDVIYASVDEHMKPAVIAFEHKHLESSKKSSLASFLRDHGYDVVRMRGADWIALRGATALAADPSAIPSS